MNNLRIATITVDRTGFSEFKARLELLGLCLLKAGRKNCDVMVFPGGYFRVGHGYCKRLEQEIRQQVQMSGVPCVVGVDFANESDVILKKSISRLRFNKRQSMQSHPERRRPPEVWVIDSSVRKFQEIWGRPMRGAPGVRRVLAGKTQVLPLCCGDVFIRKLTEPCEQLDLIAVTAHWSIWPIQWIRALRRAALANHAVIALAQHLVVPPGKNYVYDQKGDPCTPNYEGWVKEGFIGAYIRVFEVPKT